MPEFDKDRYAAIVTLLGVLGVENAAQLPPERAEIKLAKRLIKQGVPEGLSPEHQKLAEELAGATIASAPPASEAPIPTEETASVESAPPTPDKDGKQPYRLASVDGREDRVEMLTPAFAEARNKRRSDDRRWMPDPGASLTQTEEIQPKETDVKKVTKKTAAANKKAVKAKEVRATNEKGVKETSKNKKAAAPKEEKAKTSKSPKVVKPKTEGKKGPKGPRVSGGAAKFRDILADRKAHPKADVIAELVKSGIGEPSARAYIVWAKRDTKDTNPGKGGNPFGFVVIETKTEDGVKMIRRR